MTFSRFSRTMSNAKIPRPSWAHSFAEARRVFRQVVEERYIKLGKTSTAVRRHTQGNVHVTEQTPTTAKVRTYMLISSVPSADKLHILTTGTYNAISRSATIVG